MTSQQDGNRTIGPGAILVEQNTLLPEPLRLESGSDVTGWARVADNPDGRQLEKKLTAAGWTFFYMAGKIRTLGFGFESQKMIQAALKRLITTVRQQKCNCLEIDDVAMHSFWGMPYASVTAHARHIQKGMVFSGQWNRSNQ